MKLRPAVQAPSTAVNALIRHHLSQLAELKETPELPDRLERLPSSVGQ